MSDTATPETGALTVDQAIASLVSPPPEEQPQAEAPVAAAEPEITEPEGADQTPEDAPAEPEQPAEGEEAEAEQPEAVAPLDPPKYWSQDAKAKFADLPPELQAVVLQQEGPREEAAAKAKAEAAEQVKAATAELSKVQSLAVALNERLPQWIQAFETKWGTQNPDWVAFAQEHGVEAMTLAKVQFEADRQQLQAAAEETRKTQVLAHEQFVKTEFTRLAEIEPDLAPSVADPKQGAEKRQGVVKFLVASGIPQDAIAQISAVEMSLAYDAMRWREGKAALTAAPKPKPAAPAPKASVRPAAAQAQVSPQKQQSQTAANRFAQTKSVDDAVALLLARQGSS